MERIQKYLANQGLASRRQIEKMIAEGRISVNGKPAKVGDKVEGKERFTVDGKPYRVNTQHYKPKLLMYHKPIGEVCTRNDPEGRKTVYANLPRLQQGRWVGVGRLDINTSGILLFTNHGELANRLMHPKYQVEREYAVRVRGEVTDEILEQLKTGVELEDGTSHFDHIIDVGGEGTNHWYHVILREGKNREVRRLWEAVDCEVSRLQRVRYENFSLPKWLRATKFRFFEDDTVKRVFDRLELSYPEKTKR
ncbi:MAG: pseudouridine synthase [Gammaproteobacteria bacterium]|nr:pseudouridine synthase [Gammaproteobacteria bacterium]